MAGGLSRVSEAQRMTFLEIHIYSRMPTEPLPRVGAALGSGYTDSTASLGQGAHSLGWGRRQRWTS